MGGNGKSISDLITLQLPPCCSKQDLGRFCSNLSSTPWYHHWHYPGQYLHHCTDEEMTHVLLDHHLVPGLQYHQYLCSYLLNCLFFCTLEIWFETIFYSVWNLRKHRPVIKKIFTFRDKYFSNYLHCLILMRGAGNCLHCVCVQGRQVSRMCRRRSRSRESLWYWDILMTRHCLVSDDEKMIQCPPMSSHDHNIAPETQHCQHCHHSSVSSTQSSLFWRDPSGASLSVDSVSCFVSSSSLPQPWSSQYCFCLYQCPPPMLPCLQLSTIPNNLATYSETEDWGLSAVSRKRDRRAPEQAGWWCIKSLLTGASLIVHNFRMNQVSGQSW